MKSEVSAQQLIDVNDPNELSAWSASLAVTAEQLKSAVAQVGAAADKVTGYLQRNAVVQAETARRAEVSRSASIAQTCPRA